MMKRSLAVLLALLLSLNTAAAVLATDTDSGDTTIVGGEIVDDAGDEEEPEEEETPDEGEEETTTEKIGCTEKEPDDSELLTGTLFGSEAWGETVELDDRTYDKAFDGDISTFYDAKEQSESMHVGVKVENPTKLTEVHIVPRTMDGNYEPEVTVIDGSNSVYGEGENKEDHNNLLDGDPETVWCSIFDSENKPYVIWKTDRAISLSGYQMWTGCDTADYPWRNPTAWTLYGSNDPDVEENDSWVEIHKVTDAGLPEKDCEIYEMEFRYVDDEYEWIISTDAYQYFKLIIDDVAEHGREDGTTNFQLGEFRLCAEGSVVGVERMNGMTVQGSSDGENWADLYTFEGNYWTDRPYVITADEMNYVDKYSFTQFRVINREEHLNVAEVEFFGVDAPEDMEALPSYKSDDSVCLTSMPTAKLFGDASWDDNKEHTYDKAFDGDTDTYYDAYEQGSHVSIGVDIGKYAQLDKIRVYPGYDAEYDDESIANRTGGLTIQGSVDGENWISLYRFPDNCDYDINTWYEVTSDELLSAADYSFKQFRVINISNHLYVAEVELYGTLCGDDSKVTKFPTEFDEPVYSYMTVDQYIKYSENGETFDDWYFRDTVDDDGEVTRIESEIGTDGIENQIIVFDGVGFDKTAIDLSEKIDGHSVFAVYYNALHGKSGITSVTMDDDSTCKYILGMAFNECEDLESVKVSKSLYRVDDWAFQWCPLLEEFTGCERDDFTEEELDERGWRYVFVDDGVLFSNEKLVCYPPQKYDVRTYNVPDYVSFIANGAFVYADVDTIKMNENVLEIYYGAFMYSDVQEVYLSRNLRWLGDDAFMGCELLTYVECLSDKLVIDRYMEEDTDLTDWNFMYNPYMFSGTDPFDERFPEDYPVVVCGYEGGVLDEYIEYIHSLEHDEDYDMGHVVFKAYKTSDDPEDDIVWFTTTYDVCGENEVFIIGVSAPLDCAIDTLPTEVDGKTVVGLNCDGVWSGLTNDSRVGLPDGTFTVPEGIRYLWGRPFGGCDNLTTLVLPSTLEQVDALHDNVPNLKKFVVAEANPHFYTEDDGATLYCDKSIISFANGSGKTEITVKDGTEVVEYSAFERTNIKKVILPESVREIGNWAFNESALEEITLPKNVGMIWDGAFSNCESLTSVTVKRIGSFCYNDGVDYCSVFENSDSYTVYVYENTPAHQAAEDYRWDYAFIEFEEAVYETYVSDDGIHLGAVLPADGKTEFVIPEEVMIIDDGVFEGMDVTSVTFPNTLTYIGYKAFAGCGEFDVTFTGAVPFRWEDDSFDDGVWFDNQVYGYGTTSGDGSEITRVDGKMYIAGALYIQNGVIFMVTSDAVDVQEAVVIGYDSDAIDENGVLTVPKKVENIRGGSDYTVVAIAEGALNPNYNGNPGVPTSIVLPDTIRYIGENAIGENTVNAYNDDEPTTGLTSVKLPKNVRYIADNFTFGCWCIEKYTGLDGIDDEDSTNPYRLMSVTDENGNDVDVVVNVWNKDNGRTILHAYPQGNKATEITVPASVDIIGTHSFRDSQNLKTVTLNNGIDEIWSHAFRNCQNLKTVVVPASVYGMEPDAFGECNSLTKIDIDEDNETFEWYEDGTVRTDNGSCLHILALGVIPENGVYEISDDVVVISNAAAQGSNRLKKLIIPENVEEIGDWSFSNSNVLEAVVIKGQIDLMNIDAFAYCDRLEYIKYYGEKIDIWQYEWDEFTVACELDEDGNVNYEETRKFNLILVNMESWDDPICFHIDRGGYDWYYGGEDDPDFEYYPSNNPYFECVFGDIFAGTTMTLGNSLSLDFVIDTSKLEDGGEYTAVIEKFYADGRDNVIVKIPQSDWGTYNNSYKYASFDGVAAKEMCDYVEITICDAAGNAVSYTYFDSIHDYAMRMLNKVTNDELLTLYVDMLNYGAAAQNQFEYDTDNLANADLTDEQKEYATDSVELTNNRVPGTGYAGTTLTLKSRILLDFVFNDTVIGTDYTGMYAIATYTDHYGNAKTVRIEGENFAEFTTGHHYVSVSGMAVADCRCLVTCTVYDKNGNAIAWATDSVEGYAQRNQATLSEIVEAIVKFGTSAYNYFH